MERLSCSVALNGSQLPPQWFCHFGVKCQLTHGLRILTVKSRFFINEVANNFFFDFYEYI